MNVAELAAATPWPKIEEALLKLYPDREHHAPAYRSLFLDFAAVAPSSQKMRISIATETLPQSGLAIVQVEGRNGMMQRDLPGWPDLYDEHEDSVSGNREAIFTLWTYPLADWLGMEIEEATLHSFSPSTILAHILVDMSRLGFSDGSRRAFVDSLQREFLRSDRWTTSRYH